MNFFMEQIEDLARKDPALINDLQEIFYQSSEQNPLEENNIPVFYGFVMGYLRASVQSAQFLKEVSKPCFN